VLAAALMMTVRVLVAVRPSLSVATWSGVSCRGARERQKIDKNAPSLFHGLLKGLP